MSFPWLKDPVRPIDMNALRKPPANVEHFMQLSEYKDKARKITPKFVEPQPKVYNPESVPALKEETLARLMTLSKPVRVNPKFEGDKVREDRRHLITTPAANEEKFIELAKPHEHHKVSKFEAKEIFIENKAKCLPPPRGLERLTALAVPTRKVEKVDLNSKIGIKFAQERMKHRRKSM